MSIDGEDSVYGRLRTAILSLELVPGERVSERSLESLLGASRTPIRAALMRLENEGLTQREGRGWKVTPIDLAEVRAIMEYREAVEVAAVRLAVERADDEELAALRALSEAHRGCDDEEIGLRDFSDFHLALARLSRNQFLADGMAGALTRLSRTRWLGVRTERSRSEARDEHLEIVAAIGARDTGEGRRPDGGAQPRHPRPPAGVPRPGTPPTAGPRFLHHRVGHRPGAVASHTGVE